MVPSYLIENGFIGVKQGRRGIFVFNRNDRFIGRSIDLYGEWCESEIELLLGFIRSGDTVVDVGANIGTHTVTFAAIVGHAGSVLAFEPQPSSFQLLCGNVAINCRQMFDAGKKRSAMRAAAPESRAFPRSSRIISGRYP